MNTRSRPYTGLTTLLLIALIGCTTSVVLNTVGTDTGDTTSSATAPLTVETGFADAPPGGTVQTGGAPIEGSDNVDLPAEETRSFFTAFQVDPTAEDTAGPKFVVAADIDQDGLLDLVSAWNQSQPVQLHLQRRDAAGNIS
ncbi:MAG: hypothetical protein D6788_09155, partial [Planctomycetota bacterium]